MKGPDVIDDNQIKSGREQRGASVGGELCQDSPQVLKQQGPTSCFSYIPTSFTLYTQGGENVMETET